mmetsp:Transcript_74151/g.163987  ORF Transcript_74151/g.163987 Transcript_74151/m.163987 type:complete len:458 (+) Transcript_74151:1250-2623(+)
MDPTAWGNAVGHVDNLIGLALLTPPLVIIWESFLLDNLGVQRGNTVHFERPDDGEVAHANLLAFALLEDAQGPHRRPIAPLGLQLVNPPAVYLADDLHVPRQHLHHHLDGPLLERLGHHCVIRVVASPRCKVPCNVPVQMLHIYQDAHQLRHGDGRVRVIHLDRDLIGKLLPLSARVLDELAEDILDRGTAEEVLLPQAQDLALVLVVVGIKHRGDVLSPASLLDGIRIVALVEGVKIELRGGASAPQAQVVGVVSVEAWDGIIVGHGLDDLAPGVTNTPLPVFVAGLLCGTAETHWVGDVRPGDLPWASVAEPEVGALHLASILDVLLEHTIVVTDAVTPARQGEGGHGVEEASSQAAEATVAQCRVILLIEKLLQGDAKVLECVLKVLLQIEVCQRIVHKTAHEVLGREIVSPLHVLLCVPSIRIIKRLQQAVTHRHGRGAVEILLGKVEPRARQ